MTHETPVTFFNLSTLLIEKGSHKQHPMSTALVWALSSSGSPRSSFDMSCADIYIYIYVCMCVCVWSIYIYVCVCVWVCVCVFVCIISICKNHLNFNVSFFANARLLSQPPPAVNLNVSLHYMLVSSPLSMQELAFSWHIISKLLLPL